MKRYLKLYLGLWTVFGLALISCNKDYYDADDIVFTVTAPDIAYIDSAITIKGTINQPLDIKVYFNGLSDDDLIGTLKPHTDSIRWKPINIEEGNYSFLLKIDYESKKNHGNSIVDFKSIYIKNKLNSDSHEIRK